jgi:hypothetical protein
MTEQIINCDIDPYVPNVRWTVVEHQKGGLFDWNPSQVELYLTDNQKKGERGRRVEGNALKEELKGKPVLNANVLDFLLKNKSLIPEDWWNKRVFFWGTIYEYHWDNITHFSFHKVRDKGTDVRVRCLCNFKERTYLFHRIEEEKRWYWDSFRLNDYWWDERCPASLLKI